MCRSRTIPKRYNTTRASKLIKASMLCICRVYTRTHGSQHIIKNVQGKKPRTLFLLKSLLFQTVRTCVQAYSCVYSCSTAAKPRTASVGASACGTYTADAALVHRRHGRSLMFNPIVDRRYCKENNNSQYRTYDNGSTRTYIFEIREDKADHGVYNA